MLLASLAAAVPTPVAPGASEAAVPVPMRLPPHLADAVDDAHFPIWLPTAALRALAGDDPSRLDAMVDCLTDGPPQHGLANVVPVSLLDRLLAHPRDR